MKCQLATLVVASTVLAACAGERVLTDPTGRSMSARQEARHNMVEGQYPTVEEFNAAFGSTSLSSATKTIFAAFGPDSWNAIAFISSRLNNEVSAKLTASIVNSESGAPLGANSQSVHLVRTIPFTFNTHLSVEVSTMHHNCGITGKAALEGYARLKLFPNPYNLSTIFEHGLGDAARDVSLDPCNTETEIAGGGNNNGPGSGSHPCDNANTPTLESCPPPGVGLAGTTGWNEFVSGADYGAALDFDTHGGSLVCESWHWKYSRDGGATWEKEWDTLENCH